VVRAAASPTTDMTVPADASTISLQRSPRSRGRDADVRLRVVYPRALVHEWRVTADVVLGRNPPGAHAWQVRHPTISRRHAVLSCDRARGTYLLEDLGSHNGTWVDGTRVAHEPRVLHDGAVVRLGGVILVFESGPAAAAEDAPQVRRDAVPGDSGAARRLRVRLAQVAQDPSPVLLIGDTGSGKEQIAREIHRLSGRPGPFVAVNGAALARELVESQLFGHARGAFTGASEASLGLFRSACGGTLLLDEIGEMPLDMQPKLLRAIQEGEVQPVGATRPVKVDVRLVAATNRDLQRRVEDGEFRRDLYARLAMWETRVPSLEERRGDLLSWIDRLHAAWRVTRGLAAAPLELTPEAAEALLLARWHENLRGVDRLVHELAGDADAKVDIGCERLPGWLERGAVVPADAAAAPAAPAKPAAPPTREELVAVLQDTAGNVRATARHFGRDRRQIYRWLEQFGLTDLRRG
jgi:transcriptional regulator with GAF, ATPase, and Fis domain